ncbi:MAG: glycosyltransferase [Bacteroidota bacterium]
MKRTIVYVIDGLSMGGAERLMIHILRYLDRQVFEARVCVLQQKDGNPVGEDIRSLGVQVDSLPVRRLRDLTAIPRIAGYLRRVRADLVHTQLEFANVLGTLAARLVRVPSVSTIHVLPSVEARLKGNLHHRLEAFVLRNFCDRVIAVSEGARQLHIAATRSRPAQVITIYNGIDLANFTTLDRASARSSIRQELNIPETASVLTTVAVLRPEKGIQYMLEALPGILEVHPDAWYLIAGDGSHRAELMNQAEALSPAGHVVFAGMRRDVPRILAASDIFVLPTLTEALPTVLAEAMASHLPIIASPVGGVPEMVADGVNGRLVASRDVAGLADACTAMLSDRRSSEEMGERGWQIVSEKFSIPLQVERLKQLYLELIDGHGR